MFNSVVELLNRLLKVLFPDKAQTVRTNIIDFLPEAAKRAAERKRKRDELGTK